MEKLDEKMVIKLDVPPHSGSSEDHDHGADDAVVGVIEQVEDVGPGAGVHLDVGEQGEVVHAVVEDGEGDHDEDDDDAGVSRDKVHLPPLINLVLESCVVLCMFSTIRVVKKFLQLIKLL